MRESVEMRFWLKIISAVFAAMLLLVWEHVEALRVRRQVGEMRREADRLTYENGRLETLVQHWETPSNLDVIARKQFGMNPPEPQKVIGLQKK